jgi:hypothetical protein
VLAAMAAAQQPDGDGELVGLWEFTYPGSGCVETMDFHADGNFEGRGGEEIYGGTWVLNPDASVAGRRRVDLEISHDNAMPDCQNYAWNDTGMSRSLYVVFPTGESLDFYEYGDGGQPLVTFVRSTTTED